MKKTIDDYWLNRHIIQMPKKLTRPDRANYANLLIAEVNPMNIFGGQKVQKDKQPLVLL